MPKKKKKGKKFFFLVMSTLRISSANTSPVCLSYS